MKYYQPLHLNSNNRGCEAITKGTSILLGQDPKQLVSLSQDSRLDENFGYNDYCTIVPIEKKSYISTLFVRFVYKLPSSSWWKKTISYNRRYKAFLDLISKEDIMLSTGGDMLCYDDNEVIYTNDYLSRKNIKTVLWACSFSKKNITPRKLETLKKFSLIYARESLSQQVFLNLGLRNIVCLPDPAFVLSPQECSIPICFDQYEKVVGLNISNYTLKNDDITSPLGRDLLKLIDKITLEKNSCILLIPHVLWNAQDDRISSKILMDACKNQKKIFLLDTENYNYCQIRYIISRLHSFIGARTHSIISAYSTSVPAIALGYSIKSRGIAYDLGLSEALVVDTKSYNDGSLLNSYKYLELNYEKIKAHITRVLPEYTQRVFKIREILKSL